MPKNKAELKKFLDTLVEEVKVRTRFELFNDLVGDIVKKPDYDEIVAAIYDGLGDINSREPATKYSIEFIMNNPDTRWKKALMLVSSRNVIQSLIFDWTANGMSAQIEDLSIENKLDDYHRLYEILTNQFDDLIDKLKHSALRYYRTAIFSTNNNYMTRTYRTTTSTTMIKRYIKSTNIGNI